MPHALTSSACPVMSAACPGVAAAKYASEMGASDTVKHELGSSTHTSSKAFFVVSHANYVHPREAVVVTYFQNSLRDELKQLFPVADVDGKPGYRRVVYNLCRGSKKQKQQVLNKYLATCGRLGMVAPCLRLCCWLRPMSSALASMGCRSAVPFGPVLSNLACGLLQWLEASIIHLNHQK